MKRPIAVLLTLICLLGCCVFEAAAAADPTCEAFERAVAIVRFGQEGHDVAEGQPFAAKAVLIRVLAELGDAYYNTEDSSHHVPAKLLEDTAIRHFNMTEAQVRAMVLEGETVYREGTSEYVFGNFGGMGTPDKYIVRGYKKTGNRYEVYFTQGVYGYQVKADDLEFEDYILYSTLRGESVAEDYAYGFQDNTSLRVVFEYDGKTEKLMSWAHLTSLPDLSGFVNPRAPKSVTTTAASTTATITPSGKTEDDKVTSPAAGTGTTAGTTRLTATSGNTEGVAAPTEPLKVITQTETVTIAAATGTFPENVVVSARPITGGEIYRVATTALKEITDKITVYEITATSNNVKVQPNGRVTATFTIPDGYDAANTAIVYVSPTGRVEVLVSKVDKEASTVSAELSHFSTYVVAELPATEPGPNVWRILFSVMAMLLLVGGGVYGYLYLRRRPAAE